MLDTAGGGRGRDWKASSKPTGPMDIEEVEGHPCGLSCICQGLGGTTSRLAQEDPVGYLGPVGIGDKFNNPVFHGFDQIGGFDGNFQGITGLDNCWAWWDVWKYEDDKGWSRSLTWWYLDPEK